MYSSTFSVSLTISFLFSSLVSTVQFNILVVVVVVAAAADSHTIEAALDILAEIFTQKIASSTTTRANDVFY